MTDSPLFLLIDIGGSQSKVALAREDGTLSRRRDLDHPLNPNAAWIWESICERVADLLEARPGLSNDSATCGIGFGGPVQNGRPLRSEHVPGWDQIDPCKELKQRFGLNSRIENDGLAGALGEFHFGAARGTQNAVYLTVSTGIGGGIIVNGKLYRGSHGYAGHLGHLKIGPAEVLCPCGGHGCFEALCSGTAIARRLQEQAARCPSRAGKVIDMAGGIEKLTARHLFDEARKGDPFALEVMNNIGRDFGRGLASIVHSFDPDRIVIGGGVPKAGRVLFDLLDHHLKANLLSQFTPHREIRPAALGEDSVLLGALALVLERGG